MRANDKAVPARTRPFAVLVTGPAGSGKSTVAREIALAARAVFLSSARPRQRCTSYRRMPAHPTGRWSWPSRRQSLAGTAEPIRPVVADVPSLVHGVATSLVRAGPGRARYPRQRPQDFP